MRFSRSFALVLAVAAWGLVSSPAGAADVTVGFELQPGQLPPTHVGAVMNLDVYGYMPDTSPDTGIQQLWGALLPTGALLGNLSFAAAPGLRAAGFSNGTVQDLNGDGDLDVGGTNGNSAAGWIHLYAGDGVFAPVISGTNKVLLGTAAFTVTGLGWNTSISWAYRVKTTLPNTLDSYYVDGVLKSVPGNSSALASNPSWPGPLEPPPVIFDENGHGSDRDGFLLPYAIGRDPGPGGLANALIYGPRRGDYLGTVGDVRVFLPGHSLPSDIVRFNGDGTVILYSEQADSNSSLADTGLPASFYSNSVDEYAHLEGNQWVLDYSPQHSADSNQPGYDLSDVSLFYHITLDVPEPMALVVLVAGGLAIVRRRRGA